MQRFPPGLIGFLIPLKYVGASGARPLLLHSFSIALADHRNMSPASWALDPSCAAAVGMGMTGRQILWQVEFALAMT